MRFVVGPDARVVPDVLGKLPGRGIWVAADRKAMETAARKSLFSRAARQQVTVPDGLVAGIEDQLLRRVTELLALARKAGDAVCGYEKVKGWLLTGEAQVLLQASDGSTRGKSKLKPPMGPASFVGCLTGSELGLAFGRESVIHAALAAGGLTERIVEEAARLSGVRGNTGIPGAGKDETNT